MATVRPFRQARVSPTFRDFSGRHVLEVEAFAQPDSLSALCAEVRRAEVNGWPVHAMGSAWAFSAPAYCTGMVIQTELLRGFPAGVQGAINNPISDGKVLVAVEAGIRIRDLCLALAARPRELKLTLAPQQQLLGAPMTLTLTVRDGTGAPIPGADVTIENYDERGLPVSPVVFTTDASGVVSFPITFNPKREIEPGTHQWVETDLPVGTVAAAGFQAADLPLDFSDSAPLPTPPPDPDEAPWLPPWELTHARDLWPATLGGAGGQSLAGAISTGTHGGDVARPPIGDYVRAALVVGSGGVIRLLQRDENLPVVDFGRLASSLSGTVDPATVLDATSTETFDAAIVSVGRFGVVYAYVLEVHDEAANFIYQHRSTSSWEQVKSDLATSIDTARIGDEFLQVVVNPVRPPDGNRACYVTRHKKLPRDQVAEAGAAFGLGAGVASTAVAIERARETSSPPPVPVEWRLLAAAVLVLQQVQEHFHGKQRGLELARLCANRLTPELESLRDQLRQLGTVATAMLVPGSEMCFAAADSIERIGPDHKLGDAVADALNAGPPQIVDQLVSSVIEIGQRPWLVHGTRYEISDNFDYSNDCYRGDSVEIFFAADTDLPRKAELVFGAFDSLRTRGIVLAAWISLRFMAPSRSLLGMAAFAPVSCAIEVAMLRGGKGNDEALRVLQDIAVQNDGRIHWGQQNDLIAGGVAAMYGERYVRWCRSLEGVERASPTFSNPFTQSHGLEHVPFVPPRRLNVSVDPATIPLGIPVTVIVRAEDANRAPVAGTVTIANFPAGVLEVSEHPTNTAFTLAFEASPGEFDPDTHVTFPGEQPSGSVVAEGYEPAMVPFVFGRKPPVATGPRLRNDAVMSRQSAPLTLQAGARADVSVTMRNVGTTTWDPAQGYALGSQSPQDNTTWGLHRVPLAQVTPPNEEAVFSFAISAPAAFGGSDFQWQMVQDGVEWFGDATTPLIVTSVPPTEPARCDELRRAISEIDAEIARLSDLLIDDPQFDGPRLAAIARLQTRKDAHVSEAESLNCML
jgi:hypothetical protein